MSAVDEMMPEVPLAEEDLARAGLYALLARLLYAAPDEELGNRSRNRRREQKRCKNDSDSQERTTPSKKGNNISGI